jgi:5-(carboxyamino)imidazole ribonucleotide synthase
LETSENLVRRIGVIGGGQLAWMMAEAAGKLGVQLVVQTLQQSDPAVGIAADTVLAEIDDAAATAQLARQVDRITFENEFVDLDALKRLQQQGICFRPALAALEPLLDKYHQRLYLQGLGLPVPDFSTLEKAGTDAQLHPPLVLKTRRHGYDGQGTFILKSAAELQATLERLQAVPLLLEEFVPFERELAVIAARSEDGTVVSYPIVETQQENQVCRRVFAPAPVSAAVVLEAEAIARTLLTSLGVVGVFGIELFLTKDERLLVNEIAPRVHNSGHFTLDACATSQFEQHLRAVCGLPLGSSVMHCAAAVMVNLLGYEHSHSDYQEKRQQLAALPHAHVYWYGKTESRPGRKLGHVTVLLESAEREEMETIARSLELIWHGN